MLDGNAAGGLLSEVFAFEATAALTTCAGCASTMQMGELRLYAIELGAVLRCPACGEAVLRISRTPRGVWLDLQGTVRIVAASTEGL
jgi:DNA-directed RNA polymerase subunit RPC12/RpoP